MILKIDINNLKTPKAFGYIVGYYMMDAETYNLKFSELPEKMQVYYSYLDIDERKRFVAMADKDTGIVIGDWMGDRCIVYNDMMCAAPFFYKESVWMFQNGESLRWEIDLENKLNGVEDDYERYME